ncbi:MAG: hypothetical protein ACTSXP_02010 [Promethearchaeota archaeon]
MKIRTAVNVLAFPLSGLDIFWGIYLLMVFKSVPLGILHSILLVLAGALYLYIAKIMWSLNATIKFYGKILLIAILVVGTTADIFLLTLVTQVPSSLPYIICNFTFIMISVVNTGLGYWAESRLIEKKFLVYSKPRKKVKSKNKPEEKWKA